MRTAIFLLLGILVIVLIGSFVPQQNTSDPTKVEAFLTSWPNLNVLFADLQLPLTQVFVSPVFYVLLGLLYVSLGWCVIRRGRALVMRTLRGYKRTPQYWGEWGSWLFHTLVLPAARRGGLGQGDRVPGPGHAHPGPGVHEHARRLRHAAAGPALPRQLRAVHAAAQQLRGDVRAQRRGQQLRQQRDRVRPRQEGRDQEHPASTISSASTASTCTSRTTAGRRPSWSRTPRDRPCTTGPSSSSTTRATSATRRSPTASSRCRTSATRSPAQRSRCRSAPRCRSSPTPPSSRR